jgi:hypothetical protein
MNTLVFLSLQRVTDDNPVAYDNEERYRYFRETLPVPLGNTRFNFSRQAPEADPQERRAPQYA